MSIDRSSHNLMLPGKSRPSLAPFVAATLAMVFVIIGSVGANSAETEYEKTQKTRIGQLQTLIDRMSSRLRDLNDEFGYISGGMRKSLDGFMKSKKVDWARKNYAGHWSEQLAYGWELNLKSAENYLGMHRSMLEDVRRQAKNGGTLTAANIEYLNNGFTRWQEKSNRIRDVYVKCAFPQFAAAGGQWDQRR